MLSAADRAREADLIVIFGVATLASGSQPLRHLAYRPLSVARKAAPLSPCAGGGDGDVESTRSRWSLWSWQGARVSRCDCDWYTRSTGAQDIVSADMFEESHPARDSF